VVRIAHRSALGERGQALVEYAMIVAIIGACLVAILGLVGRATRNAYDRTSSSISNRTTSAYPAQGGGGMGGGGLSGSVRVIPASSGQPPDSAGDAGSPDSAAASHSPQ
jgi:Flp pilus assembly pilin Flp